MTISIFRNGVDLNLQTSLTDLSTLGHVPPSTKASIGTQYQPPPPPSHQPQPLPPAPAPSLATTGSNTTSSSSQPLRDRHVNANVVRISVSSREDSSIPSSAGDPREKTLLTVAGKENALG